MYVQPLDGALGANALPSAGGVDGEGALLSGAPAAAAGDNISRFMPPWLRDNAADVPGGALFGGSGSLQGLFGPLMGMLQQLMQMLQSLMGNGGNAPYSSSQCPSGGNERYFRNATASSDGDPHLSFNNEHWDNMKSHPDLLHSDSFNGGYRVSTQVTPANGKGATWNQSASVTLDGGATTVSLNNKGDAQITSYGHSVSIARGETVALGNGESVTCDRNGSLSVTAENDSGGRITTTLSARGEGVDVDVSAHDVDLGGALVNGYEHHRHEPENPIAGPAPIPEPIQHGRIQRNPIEFQPDE